MKQKVEQRSKMRPEWEKDSAMKINRLGEKSEEHGTTFIKMWLRGWEIGDNKDLRCDGKNRRRGG